MMTRAVIVHCESGHNYLIPMYLRDEFYKDLEEAGETEVNSADLDKYPEGSYTYRDFDDEWSQYIIGGDYEIYAEFD